ncbi:serine acetyltransferase, partial [Flavobacterium sp. LBUM151]
MSKNTIIQNIKALKSHSNINYGIKTKTEDFTEKLFYTLFDSNAPLDESIDELEIRFKEIAVLACQKPQNLCGSIWDRFLEKLPSVLEMLNQDA